jgi:signal transduction histidine kinase
LRQVFSNLLLNAVESMPKGGKIQARVSSGHEWSGQERQGVRVTVADNGSGIPAGVLPRIFQRFFTITSGGNGMGLSLVKDIVQKHKGSLRQEQHAGQTCTVFNLFLPAVWVIFPARSEN